MKLQTISAITLAFLALPLATKASTLTLINSFNNVTATANEAKQLAYSSVTGHVWVTDQNSGKVEELNPTNGSVTSYGGSLNHPDGIAVDGTGKIWVSDQHGGKIDSFSSSNFAGSFTSYGTSGTGSGKFSGPVGLTVGSDGKIYVADDGNHRVVSFSPSNFSGTFATTAVTGYQNTVAFDGSGLLYVGSYQGGVVRYNPANPSGTMTTFGSVGQSSPTQFYNPYQIAVGPDGNVYVADPGADGDLGALMVFDPSNFTTTASYLFTGKVTGITFDGSGNLFVADATTSTIREYSVSSAPEPSSAGLALLAAVGVWGYRKRLRASSRRRAQDRLLARAARHAFD